MQPAQQVISYSVMNLIKTLPLFLLLFAASLLAEPGEIVKCIQPDGSVVYSNVGCGSGKAEPVALKPILIVESTNVNFNFLAGLHVNWLLVVLALYLLMSIICFLVYWLDKQRSLKDEWRIPESTLHVLEFLGGWPGAFIAQHTLQHKNRKRLYQLVFGLIVFVHALLWVDYFSHHALLEQLAPIYEVILNGLEGILRKIKL